MDHTQYYYSALEVFIKYVREEPLINSSFKINLRLNDLIQNHSLVLKNGSEFRNVEVELSMYFYHFERKLHGVVFNHSNNIYRDFVSPFDKDVELLMESFSSGFENIKEVKFLPKRSDEKTISINSHVLLSGYILPAIADRLKKGIVKNRELMPLIKNKSSYYKQFFFNLYPFYLYLQNEIYPKSPSHKLNNEWSSKVEIYRFIQEFTSLMGVPWDEQTPSSNPLQYIKDIFKTLE